MEHVFLARRCPDCNARPGACRAVGCGHYVSYPVELPPGLSGAHTDAVTVSPTTKPAEPAAIAEGSVVRLKSGGPKLVVEGLGDDGVADTVRFVAHDAGWRVERHRFGVTTLELAVD